MAEAPRLLDYWQSPPGVGAPQACFATSFTFHSDFFERQCLARFLGIDSPRGDRGGLDLAYLLQTEELLSETQVSVLVDRSARPGIRSLRWDVIPVGIRGGLLHAKVSVLVWERLVRVILGSANLTPGGYRNQIETAVVLEAAPGAAIPEPVLLELLNQLDRILERAVGDRDRPGPVARAAAALDLARKRIESFELPEKFPRRAPIVAVAPSGDGPRALDALHQVWLGGPPRCATVLSPFWDSSGPNGGAVTATLDWLARRGAIHATFLGAVDPINGTYRVPATLSELSTSRLTSEVRSFEAPDDRRLHAKVVLLESDSWTAALVGSSNFTEAGLGLASHSHMELNLAIGAESGSSAAKALVALAPVGGLIPDEATWSDGEDEDERPDDPLPWGFLACLFEPTKPARLHLRLSPLELPKSWSIALPGGKPLLDSGDWSKAGSPASHEVVLESGAAVVWLDVDWRDAEGDHSATWIVNVTEPARLPPPHELRDLPFHLLVRALGSSRPLYQTIAEALAPQEYDHDSHSAILDPLLRFDNPNGLLRRAREFSAAMAGLRQRLERPAASVTALEWRLLGPVGPIAIADAIVRESPTERIAGESVFLLAELVLTLGRVRWEPVIERLEDQELARQLIRKTAQQLKKRRKLIDVQDPGLESYVRAAMRSVG